MAISYPLEISENPDFYRSMIEFRVYETAPSQLSQLASKETYEAVGGGETRFADSLLGRFIDNASQGKASLLTDTSGPAFAKEVITLAEGFETIQLYMPVGFQMTDTLSYANAELGATGAVALGAAQGGANLAGAAGAAISEGMAGITDTLSSLLGSGNLGQLGLARLGQKVGGPLGAAAEIAGQAVMNPNIRATFKSVGLRRFQFLFNLIPKNAAEADAIDAIINTFRTAAYPENISAGPVSLAFKYPNLFRIIPKVKTDRGFFVHVGTPITYCYLESITVGNNPIGNNTFHADGHAIQTDLSLNFIEYRTISRDDIKMGYRPVDGDADPPKQKISGRGR